MKAMRRLTFLALFLGFPAAGAAEVDVRVAGRHLDVKARAPLSEIIDRIGKQAGIKVVYDGAPPRQLVATELHAVTPARAITSLLEGQNVNYAASMDRTGERVTMLMILGSGAKPGVSASMPPPQPVISTGYDESDAVINGDLGEDSAMEEEPAPEEEIVEPELEEEPSLDPNKVDQPDAEAAIQAPPPGPGVFLQNGSLAPGIFPQPGAAAAEAGAGEEKPVEDPTREQEQ